jgi:sigma-B regulation protein RsbQ
MTTDILKRNTVKITGKGEQPMLFAHGFGCDQNFWHLVAPAFADQYRVILFDYVGAGSSDRQAYDPERYSSLNGYAFDILEVCHTLDLKDVIFVGHSISSMIGILASIQEPALFKQLILLGASPCFFNDPPHYMGGFQRADLEGLLNMMENNYVGWASFVAPVAMKNPDRPELAHELENSFNAADHAILQQFASLTFLCDEREALPKVTVPSLILQPSEDSFVPLAVGKYLEHHLADSTLQVMKATGHFPHVGYPAETIQAIKGYLAQVPAV